MARKTWRIVEVRYCERVGRQVRLEAQVVEPAEHLPDQPPRVLARRCSNAMECNKIEKMACAYCGTNPNYIPS
jgi:hypothetical protein